MTHQTVSLGKYWKLFPTTLKKFEMAAREKSTSEGGLSARCISLLEEVKEIIEGGRDPATNATTNGDETSAGMYAKHRPGSMDHPMDHHGPPHRPGPWTRSMHNP